MSRYLSVIIGFAAAIAGVILFLSWNYEFFFLLRAMVPVFMVIAGVISVIAGLSEIKDRGKNGGK